MTASAMASAARHVFLALVVSEGSVASEMRSKVHPQEKRHRSLQPPSFHPRRRPEPRSQSPAASLFSGALPRGWLCRLLLTVSCYSPPM